MMALFRRRRANVAKVTVARERLSQASTSNPVRVAALVDELIAIYRGDDLLSLEPGGKFDENNRHKRARQIGRELNNLGGLELMRAAAYLVVVAYRLYRGEVRVSVGPHR